MEVGKVSIKKEINWKKWLTIAVSVILGLTSLTLLTENNALKEQLISSNNANVQSIELTAELAKKEEELQLCLEDKPKYGETIKKPYSYQEFGVYSSDFEGKEIEITTYEYKRSKIMRKSISSDDSDNQHWGIDVWELDSYSYTLPSLEGYTAFGSQNDFPIFDGYENYGNPRWISVRMADWKNQESYTNKNDIKMYLSYGYAPKSIGSVYYEFYNPNSASSNQAFVVLWNGVRNYPLASGVNDPSVIEAKEELKKLADNVNLRMP